MSEASKPRNRAADFALLGVAVAIALGVGLFFALSGSGDDGPAAPEEVVRQLYAAVGKDDATAFNNLLDPALRDSPTRAIIPFRNSAGSFDVGAGKAAKIEDLVVRPVNNEGGWASVSARGQVTIEGKSQPLNESLYLRGINGKWFVSTEEEFQRVLGVPASSKTPAVKTDLGPIGPGRPKDGELAPDFALIDARDGVTVRKLSDFRGKVVIVNWYASWCGPCKAEIPEFQDAYAALGGDVVVLGIDFQESRERAVSILDIFKAKYPALLDTEGTVAEQWRATVLPTTYFIDKDGVVRVTRYGQVRASDLPDLLAKVGVTYTPR